MAPRPGEDEEKDIPFNGEDARTFLTVVHDAIERFDFKVQRGFHRPPVIQCQDGSKIVPETAEVMHKVSKPSVQSSDRDLSQQAAYVVGLATKALAKPSAKRDKLTTELYEAVATGQHKAVTDFLEKYPNRRSIHKVYKGSDFGP